MKLTVQVEGLSDCLDAFEALPHSLQKPAMRRVLVKAAEPIRAAAESLAPRETGELAASIVISSSYANNVGKAEYSAVLSKGGTKAEAVNALKAARRAVKAASGRESSSPIPFVWVGPAAADNKADAIKRIVQEFGSKKQAPRAYMRPSWDAHKTEALSIISSSLMPEIEKTMARYTARAARLAAKGK